MQTLGLFNLLVLLVAFAPLEYSATRVFGGDTIALPVLADCYEESSEVTHQNTDPSRSRFAALTFSAA